jgi:hypothetical protein
MKGVYRAAASLIMLAAVVLLPLSTGASASLALSPNLGPPYTAVDVTGGGFKPAETVKVFFGSTFEYSVTAGAAGGFSKSFTVPASAQAGKRHRAWGRAEQRA